MMKKVLALLLVLSLLACLGTGCSSRGKEADNQQPVTEDFDDKPKDPAPTPTATEPVASPKPEEPAAVRDYAAAKATMAGDTVVATIDGYEVTWDEYFYWLYYNVNYMESYLGAVEDWSKQMATDVTYSDFFKEYALESAMYYKAIEKKAAELGVELTDEDLADVEADWTAAVAEAGSEEALLASLEASFLTRDIYDYVTKMSYLKQDIFTEKYGVYGKNMPAEDVLTAVADEGYMMAKHILLSTIDDDGNVLGEAEIVEKKAKAEEALAKLQAFEFTYEPDENLTEEENAAAGAAAYNEALDAYFSDLVAEYSEDPGSASFPSGYLFKSGDMIAAFETAVLGLEEYSCSGIVESDYGYHIILRLPINVDAIPTEYISYISEGYVYTLRFIVAWNTFSNEITEWQSECQIELSDELNALDLGELFAKA